MHYATDAHFPLKGTTSTCLCFPRGVKRRRHEHGTDLKSSKKGITFWYLVQGTNYTICIVVKENLVLHDGTSCFATSQQGILQKTRICMTKDYQISSSHSLSLPPFPS